MMFASLVPRNPETGDEWDDESVDQLAAHWSDVRAALKCARSWRSACSPRLTGGHIATDVVVFAVAETVPWRPG